MFSIFRKKRVGLALGGGGARGIAHLGVLKVLQLYNLFPEIVVGTSIGSIVGALFALKNYNNIDELIKNLIGKLKTNEFKEFQNEIMLYFENETKNMNIVQKIKYIAKNLLFYEKIFRNEYIISNDKFEKVLRLLLPERKIEDLPVKFATVALDLKSGNKIIINKGDLIKSVMASCAIPGIFQPVKYDKYLLVDGGWIEKVPAQTAKSLGADKVIAIDVSSNPLKNFKKVKNGFQLLLYADELTNNELKNIQLLQADLIIKIDFLKYNWLEFNKFNQIISAGEEIAKIEIDKIKKLFKRKIWELF